MSAPPRVRNVRPIPWPRWFRTAAPAAGLTCLLVVPALADLRGTIPPPSGDAVVTADGRHLWFVELAGAPTSEGGDIASIERERAIFRAEASQAGLRYRERRAFSALWNGLSIAVDPRDVGRLDGLATPRKRYPVVAASIPEQPRDATPALLSALAMTGADVAQNELGLTGAGVKVGIIDTGVDYDHPDLGGDGVARENSGAFPNARVVGGWDFVGDTYDGDPDEASPDPYPDDCWGHGTHVAGILAANGFVRGVAPEVSLYAYRVFGCTGSTPADVLIAAMERAYADGVQVVNMSLGTPYRWPSYPNARAADRLVNRGVVVVASIGNAGESGLYSGIAPGVGNKVIAVGAFNNTHINLDGFSVTPDGRMIPYLPANATPRLPAPPTTGTAPLARTSPEDACVALPAGSLAGKVALVRRGFCDVYTQCRNAQDAGALAVVFYDAVSAAYPIDVTGFPPVTIPVVSIGSTDGLALRTRLLQGPVQLTWGLKDGAPNPIGGLVSSFSSYGPSPDLSLKPDLAAPGGSILSTVPLAQGRHANMSGTSMSAPHVSGAVALLLQARPRTPSNAVRDVLMNAADPRPSAFDLTKTEAVHRQGAGMLDVPGAILGTTRISPGKLSLGESEAGPVTRTLVIRNEGSSEAIYDFSVLTAAGTGPTTVPVTFLALPATVGIDRNPITVAAGGSSNVEVVIAPHPSQPARSLYGGYLVFTPRGGGAPARVPFLGLAGDYQTIESMTPGGPFALPWLTQRQGMVYVNRTEGATYTMEGDDVPFFFVHLEHGASRLRMELFDAATGKPWHRALDMKDAPRNAPFLVTVHRWDGETFHGRRTEIVPNGRYVMKVSALHALGDESNPDHWDTWTSPPITIARASSLRAVTAVDGPHTGRLGLSPPSPNPSVGEISFRFVLAEPGPASFAVFDASGRRLRAWTWATLPAGEHAVRWDGRTESGGSAPAGVVLCRLSAAGRTLTRKAIWMP